MFTYLTAASQYIRQKHKTARKKGKSPIILVTFLNAPLPNNKKMIIINTILLKTIMPADNVYYKRHFQELICIMKRGLFDFGWIKRISKNPDVKFCRPHILAWIFSNLYFSSPDLIKIYLFKQWHK